MNRNASVDCLEGQVCVVLLIRLETLGTRISSTLSEIISNNFNHFVFVFILYLSFCLSKLSIDALRFEIRPSALLDWEKGQFVRFNFFGQQKRDSGKQPLTQTFGLIFVNTNNHIVKLI